MLDFVIHPQVHQCKPHHLSAGQLWCHPHLPEPAPTSRRPNLGIPVSLRLPRAICLGPAGACHRAAALSSLCLAPQTTSALPQNLPQDFQPTHPLYLPALFPKLSFVVFYHPDTQHLGKTHLLARTVSFDKWKPAGSMWDLPVGDLA